MSVPLNVVIKVLQIHEDTKRVKLTNPNAWSTFKTPFWRDFNSPCPTRRRPPPLPRWGPTRCRRAPSSPDGSQNTVLSGCRSRPSRGWAGRGCGLPSSGGWGSLPFSAEVWPERDSVGPRPDAALHDRCAAPTHTHTKKGLHQNRDATNRTKTTSERVQLELKRRTLLTFASMSAPRSTMFSTRERKPWSEARWRQFWPEDKHKTRHLTSNPRPAKASL